MIDFTKPIETVPCARNPVPVPCTFSNDFRWRPEVTIKGSWVDQDGEDEGNQIWSVDDEGRFLSLDGCVRNVVNPYLKALEWIRDNPTAHRSNIAAVVKEALDGLA